MASRDLTGVLLVGGASRRFGSPKALAALDGETLAERGWRILGEVGSQRMAVGKASDQLSLPFPVIDDESDLRAPIVGVIAALRHSESSVCVVLPVDCPLVTPALLGELADACGPDVDAAVPQTGPLPGAYRETALGMLEAARAAGELALRDALRPLRVRVVDCDPTLLANVNTPEELRELN